MGETALILGASGRFGRNAADAFREAGWTAVPFLRGTDDLVTAAKGADVIVNGWNPPYPDWAVQVPGQTRQVIEAAKASGATVIIPGNVYVFGKDAPDVFGADTPHAARNGLGRIRAEMEAGYRASGVRTIVLRAGDFLDTRGSGNWFDLVMTKQVASGRFVYPGATDVPHAWAYLPDLARAAVQLAAMRGQLGAFEDVPFPGYTLTGEELHAAIGRITGRPVTLRRMNWLPLQLARPVWPMGRRLLEMRYLWSKPHRMDGTRLDALLPGFRQTPLDEALRRALEDQIDPDEAVAQAGIAAA